MFNAAKDLINQKVAVISNKFTYRGVLLEVQEDYIVLGDGSRVEIEGSFAVEQPVCEDPLHGNLIISNKAIEIIYQPNWCNAPLPGEVKGEEMLKAVFRDYGGDATEVEVELRFKESKQLPSGHSVTITGKKT